MYFEVQVPFAMRKVAALEVVEVRQLPVLGRKSLVYNASLKMKKYQVMHSARLHLLKHPVLVNVHSLVVVQINELMSEMKLVEQNLHEAPVTVMKKPAYEQSDPDLADSKESDQPVNE